LENFEKIYVNGVVILEVNLTRAILNEAIDFRKIVEEEINSGQTQLVIDLSKCDYIDSAFFGTIIMASKMLINIGYKLKVVKPTIVGESIFIHTKTPKVFDKYKTREDAIKSFEEDIQPES
jgi:anti-anti-sigma regulatory factor